MARSLSCTMERPGCVRSHSILVRSVIKRFNHSCRFWIVHQNPVGVLPESHDPSTFHYKGMKPTLPPLSVKFTALEGWPKSIECNLAWDGVRLDNEADYTYDLLDEF